MAVILHEAETQYESFDPCSFTGAKLNGHTGARTQDRGVISTALYQLSYTTTIFPDL